MGGLTYTRYRVVSVTLRRTQDSGFDLHKTRDNGFNSDKTRVVDLTVIVRK